MGIAIQLSAYLTAIALPVAIVWVLAVLLGSKIALLCVAIPMIILAIFGIWRAPV